MHLVDATSNSERDPSGRWLAGRSLSGPWRILSGFAISGMVLGLPGALLPLWDFHIHPDFGRAGNLFLAIGLGTVFGSALGRRLDRQFSSGKVLSAGCFLAALAFLAISLAGPPAPAWAQWLVLILAGLSAGLINTAIFEAITPWYETDPARTSLIAGSFFGAGSFATAFLLSRALDTAAPPRWLALLALIPAFAGVLFSRLRIHTVTPVATSRRLAIEELRSPIAIIFALLLFFQFANEWSLAGWLPVFLVDRLGLSPSTAVTLLALYWLALMLGRLAGSRLLLVARHGRLLAGSAACALVGCTALMTADNGFGVVTGLLLTGLGFSAIYPLAAERIASRFSYYHPGYFNGIFTFALMGGILSPFVLGHWAERSGLSVLPLAVLAGSCAVFGLVLLIWLGSKVSGH